MGIPALTQPKRTILPSESGYDSTDPGGEGGGTVDPTPPALSGGDETLSYSISSLEDGATLTLATNGAFSFGDAGPSLALIMDASKVDEAGNVVPILGPDAVITAGNRVAVDDPNMPAGKAYTLDIDTSSNKIMRVSRPASSRVFDSRVYHWSQASREAGYEYLLNNASAWQIKPVWHQANGNHNGTATDFFIVTWPRWYDETKKWQLSHFISSNSIPSSTFSGSSIPTPNSERNDPPEDPLITETAWDQGDISTGVSGGSCTVFTSTVSSGYLYKGTKTGIVLTEQDAAEDDKLINGFTYPGYRKGFEEYGSPVYDADLYVSYGEGAFCRVAISDHPDYFQSSKRTLLEPINWTSNTIIKKLRNGWWSVDDLAGKWINIVGIDNQQIASVQIGGAA